MISVQKREGGTEQKRFSLILIRRSKGRNTYVYIHPYEKKGREKKKRRNESKKGKVPVLLFGKRREGKGRRIVCLRKKREGKKGTGVRKERIGWVFGKGWEGNDPYREKEKKKKGGKDNPSKGGGRNHLYLRGKGEKNGSRLSSSGEEGEKGRMNQKEKP